MSLKPIVITNLSYKRVGQRKALVDLAKYLQYRDGSVRRDSYLRGEGYGSSEREDSPRLRREAKWVDRGMGETYRQVASQAQALRGRSVLARTWVISPDPELMEQLPTKQRAPLMRRVAERTVETWYDDNGWGAPEYSYVIHDRRTVDDRQQLHAHVVTPGTIPVGPEQGRIDHVVRKPHIRNLREVAEEVFEGELFRTLGPERAWALLLERERSLLAARDRGRDSRALRGRLAALVSVLRIMHSAKRRIDRYAELRNHLRVLRQLGVIERARAAAERRRQREEAYRDELELVRLEERIRLRVAERAGRQTPDRDDTRFSGPELEL